MKISRIFSRGSQSGNLGRKCSMQYFITMFVTSAMTFDNCDESGCSFEMFNRHRQWYKEDNSTMKWRWQQFNIVSLSYAINSVAKVKEDVKKTGWIKKFKMPTISRAQFWDALLAYTGFEILFRLHWILFCFHNVNSLQWRRTGAFL